jgi:hypothetical protein
MILGLMPETLVMTLLSLSSFSEYSSLYVNIPSDYVCVGLRDARSCDLLVSWGAINFLLAQVNHGIISR